ncbi:hypothetical protein [uncultured Sphingomonas sp.]|uniref:hypothetical protein n=1 Tax=uncultured Sphingomonas sp. TaxID=158754 RepID=UPI0035CB177A
METVGQLTRRGLLPLEDVLDLYDAAVIGIMRCFKQHIADRSNDGPQRNDRFLENALWLLDAAEQRERTNAERMRRLRAPNHSGLF